MGCFDFAHALRRYLGIGVLGMACLVAADAGARSPMGRLSLPKAYIVSCLCKTPAEHARIARIIKSRGGTILHDDRKLGGFAVSVGRKTTSARLARDLGSIPGVTGVQPDRPGRPASVDNMAQAN